MIDGLAVSWSLDHLLGLLGPDSQSPSCLEQGWSGNHRLWPKTNLVTRVYELTGGADKQPQEKHWRAALTTCAQRPPPPTLVAAVSVNRRAIES